MVLTTWSQQNDGTGVKTMQYHALLSLPYCGPYVSNLSKKMWEEICQCQYLLQPGITCDQGPGWWQNCHPAGQYWLFTVYSQQRDMPVVDKRACTCNNDRETRACCGISVVAFWLQGGCPVKINILVAWEKLLGFNLLIGMNAIKELGGVGITPSGAVEFDRKPSLCAALTIEEPDFSVKFNQEKKAWAVSADWKSDTNEPTKQNSKVSCIQASTQGI